MQDRARIVVIGAGIAGTSTVYHLAQLGWKDIVVVDQGPLFKTGGSTSHAPGLLFVVNSSRTMANFAKYTTALDDSMKLNGERIFWKTGGMEVAWTKERWYDLKRKYAYGKSWGVGAELLGPSEARAKVPLLSEKIYGAMYSPNDGAGYAHMVAEALALEAQKRGAATFYGDTKVTGIEVVNGQVKAVNTDKGRIQTDIVLCCAGIWGPLVGKMAGVTVPLYPMRHQYAVTEPLPELKGEKEKVRHPILRHQDEAMYFRQEFDSYLVGAYRHEPMLVEPEDILEWKDSKVMPSVMDWAPSIFEQGLRESGELLPATKGKGLKFKLNGMFSFTADGMPLMGESPNVRGFWMAEAVWITHAGGVGKAMAEWLVQGYPELDMRECDVARFHPHALTKSYVRTRSAQQFREVYDIIHPGQQMENPRNLRLTPFYPRLKELDAEFFEGVGWERPQWFKANAKMLEQYPYNGPKRTEWQSRFWSPIIAAEHHAVRNGVGMFDITPFTKIEVTGPGALKFLQSITSNNLDQPVGRIVYTAMPNHRGGIRADLTITRLSEDRFLVLTGGGMGMLDLFWLRKNALRDGSVSITDVTSSMFNIGLWGPKSRDVLKTVVDEDISNDAFPYMTAKRMQIQEIPVLAIRISYVGELGWEIYGPAELGLRAWDILWKAGRWSGITAVGGGAFETLRLEKGYRMWGSDIHTEYNPYEAGIGFAVRPNKGDFIGRDALAKIKKDGVKRKLVCITMDEPNTLAMGKEPILDGSKVLGYVTSANYGYTVGKSIVYGYVPTECAAEGTKVQIEHFKEIYPATVTREPLLDPENLRLKG
ncbi:MAG: FAD-dependent oxidoreductase [SAR202 cluster bacterium]|nr:FAD-dependent oxidoreductase [SAR202 cluster bacterium]